MSTSFTWADDGVCAQVKLELQQTLVITRTAFRATLTLNNGLDAESLTGIAIDLDIRDLDGNDSIVKFNTDTLELAGFDNIDGNGVLPPASSGSATWIIIPRRTAAPDGPVEYDFGATLTYTQGDQQFVIPMFPQRLTVLPDPFLEVKYFWERDVFADDPFTPEVVEPSQPFSLGLMITNNGAGTARNMRITSGQPKIYEDEDENGNPRGLLINFQLVGTQVGTQEVSPSLTVDFGDVTPNQTAIARFLMISSLQGHFIEYEASYEHVTGLGDPQLSLIDSLDIFELIHVVRAQQPADDGLPDFMTNEWSPYSDPPDPKEVPDAPGADPDRQDLPDHVHLSNGHVEFVTTLLDDITVTPEPGKFRAIVTAPAPGGWVYIKFPDPFDGDYRLIGAQRPDGSDMLIDFDAWQTDRTFVDGENVDRRHRIHLFDRDGGGPYTLFFVPDNDRPAATWRVLAPHGGDLGAEIALDVPETLVFTESRLPGVRRMSVTFSEPIRAESFNLISVRGLDIEGNEITIDPNTIQKTLSANRTYAEITLAQPLPDFATYCIQLLGVEDSAGNPLTDGAKVKITALVGDASNDRRVNNTDVGGVISLLGTNPINPTNFYHVRSDINVDGRIDESDLQIVLDRRGNDARKIPNPCLVGGPGPGNDSLPGRPQPPSPPERPKPFVTHLDDPRTFIPEPELHGPDR